MVGTKTLARGTKYSGLGHDELKFTGLLSRNLNEVTKMGGYVYFYIETK